jgi:CRISPR-associated protein Cas4
MVTEVDVNRWMLRALNSFSLRLLPRDEISVSEAASPCLRRAYYQRVRASIPTPVEFLKLVGEDIHKKLQDVLRSEGYRVEVGVSLSLGEFKLVGRVDAVRDGDGDEHALEFKVVEEIPEKPYETHLLQLQAYLQMLGISTGFLIYIARADGRVRVFRVSRDRRALKRFIERARALHEALKSSVPPPPEKGPWCNHCSYRLSCCKATGVGDSK